MVEISKNTQCVSLLANRNCSTKSSFFFLSIQDNAHFSNPKADIQEAIDLELPEAYNTEGEVSSLSGE